MGIFIALFFFNEIWILSKARYAFETAMELPLLKAKI